jgi:hypothetical protein
MPKQNNSPRATATMANHQKGPQRGHVPRTGRANYTTVEEIPTREEVLAGTFFLNEHPVIILFDSGASHNFMSYICAKKAKLSLVALRAPYVITKSCPSRQPPPTSPPTWPETVGLPPSSRHGCLPCFIVCCQPRDRPAHES